MRYFALDGWIFDVAQVMSKKVLAECGGADMILPNILSLFWPKYIKSKLLSPESTDTGEVFVNDLWLVTYYLP